MGKRTIDIVLISAESLKRQDPSSTMAVHAEARITEDSVPVQSTTADPVGDVNPRWNQSLSFTLRCSSSGRKTRECLYIKLYNTMPNESSCVIGSAQIPLMEFLASAGKERTAPIHTSCSVSTGGRLCFSYKLGPYVSKAARIGKAFAKTALAVAGETALTLGVGKLLEEVEGEDDDDDVNDDADDDDDNLEN